MNLETHVLRFRQEQSVQKELLVGANVDWLSSPDAGDEQDSGVCQLVWNVLQDGRAVATGRVRVMNRQGDSLCLFSSRYA